MLKYEENKKAINKSQKKYRELNRGNYTNREEKERNRKE